MLRRRSFLVGLITALAAPVVVKTQRILGLRGVAWTGEMSSAVVHSEAAIARQVTLPPAQGDAVYTVQNTGEHPLAVCQPSGEVIRFIKNPRTYKFEAGEDGNWIAKEVT